MTNQKDRHLESPGEANRDKHINFLAVENGDIDPASEDFDQDSEDVDNGFFTDDDNRLQTEEDYEEDKSNNPGRDEKVIPFEPDATTSTLGDKITVDPGNEDILTPVKDDDTESYENEDDQAH